MELPFRVQVLPSPGSHSPCSRSAAPVHRWHCRGCCSGRTRTRKTLARNRRRPTKMETDKQNVESNQDSTEQNDVGDFLPQVLSTYLSEVPGCGCGCVCFCCFFCFLFPACFVSIENHRRPTIITRWICRTLKVNKRQHRTEPRGKRCTSGTVLRLWYGTVLHLWCKYMVGVFDRFFFFSWLFCRRLRY